MQTPSMPSRLEVSQCDLSRRQIPRIRLQWVARWKRAITDGHQTPIQNSLHEVFVVSNHVNHLLLGYDFVRGMRRGD